MKQVNSKVLALCLLKKMPREIKAEKSKMRSARVAAERLRKVVERRAK